MSSRETIENTIQAANIKLEPAELALFEELIRPKLTEWHREYGNVPYTLVDAFLHGFIAAVRMRDGNVMVPADLVERAAKYVERLPIAQAATTDQVRGLLNVCRDLARHQ